MTYWIINCNGTCNLQKKKNSANAIVEIPQVNRKQMISWMEYDYDSRIMVHICGTRVTTSKQYLLSSSCGGKCPWRQAVCTWNRVCWRFTYDPLLCRLACGDLASHAFPSSVLKNLSTRSALQRSGFTMMVLSSPLSSLDIISEMSHFWKSKVQNMSTNCYWPCDVSIECPAWETYKTHGMNRGRCVTFLKV